MRGTPLEREGSSWHHLASAQLPHPAPRPQQQANRPPRSVRARSGFAAFGDSVMWGQGLRREQRFSRLLCTKLKQETGRDAEIVWDMSRSGAEIRATEEQRRQHVDRYIGQFKKLKGLVSLLNGTNDSPAAQLYGEVPCTFPTIRGQVRRTLPNVCGRSDTTLLMVGEDGGAHPTRGVP
jgi:lysophospholipase L1-like esterase